MKSFKEYISEVVATQYGHTMWVDPKGKIHDMGSSYTHHEWASKNWKKFSKTEPDHEDMWDLPYEQNWVRVMVGRMRAQVSIEGTHKAIRGGKVGKVLLDIVDDITTKVRAGKTDSVYIDTWEKNKTSRSTDKHFGLPNDYGKFKQWVR